MSIENARRIENAVLVSLPEDRVPDEGMILELATRLQIVFPIDDAEFQDVLKRLHSKLAITMDTGVALVGEEHAPWLSARKAAIEPFYWERFQHFLQKKDWPPKVVSTLDRVTDEVLDLLGDPAKPGPWKRRGLVLGDVQSGKTATYTALTCKAGDAGYKLIILLTGTLESLRRQTQERLDEGFVGLDSSGLLSQIKSNRAVGVGLVDSRKSAGVFTSREKDFSKTLLNALGFRLDSFNIPVLVVVKKNKRILENLERWLTDFNAGSNHTIDIPMLLIDDEADSASVNTNPMASDPTAINQRIRALLRLFTRSSYIGFTATPFANIFIDPETEHEMLGDDLFPRDFIYTLEPPSNYVGPGVLFGDEPTLPICRRIDDADDVFPPKHKASLVVEVLPESLCVALRAFVLATALRDLRNEGPSHRSMLVNVSRFTAVQDQVAAVIHAYISHLQQDVRNYSQLSEGEALRNRSLAELRETWDAEFATSEFDWLQVQRALLNAALPITVKAVNQRTGAASLDYATHRENGLRVIAVGGNSLSRGLTLEGLSTSYFFRNSQMYDTLLQMGRWFGYRDGYTDLCRLWLTEEAVQWYSHITLATEELRYEVKRMRQRNATPQEFGLKIRAHPDSLIVTAQNKMRLGHTIVRNISLSKEGLETTRLKNNSRIIKANKHAVLRFVEQVEAQSPAQKPSPWGNSAVWYEVDKLLVVSLLRNFDVHPLNITFQSDILADYFENTSERSLCFWDVVVANGGESAVPFGPLSVRPAERFITISQGAILVSGRNARVGSRGVEREGIPEVKVRKEEQSYRSNNNKRNVPDSVYRGIRERPLLLIYVIAPYERREDGQRRQFDTGGDELVALGLSLPMFDDSDVAKKVKYRVNPVEWKAILEDAIDDDAQGDDDDAG